MSRYTNDIIVVCAVPIFSIRYHTLVRYVTNSVTGPLQQQKQVVYYALVTPMYIRVVNMEYFSLTINGSDSHRK